MATIENTPKSGKTNRKSTRIDMTPMVDLGFLLITFFMFTTTFNEPNMMNLTLPEDGGTTKNKMSNTLTLILGANNHLFWHQESEKTLNQTAISESDYQNEVRKLIMQKRRTAKNPENFTVIVKPSEESNYKNVVDILDELAITQTERHALAELNETEKKLYLKLPK